MKGTELSPTVPILMYHKIAVPKRGSAVPHHFVQPKLFRSHLKVLNRLGFTGVRLGNLFEDALPKRPVGISFDDGYENFYHHALCGGRSNWPIRSLGYALGDGTRVANDH